MTHVSQMIFETYKYPWVKLAVSVTHMPFISDIVEMENWLICVTTLNWSNVYVFDKFLTKPSIETRLEDVKAFVLIEWTKMSMPTDPGWLRCFSI